MKRYLMTITYDGQPFCGWQKQKDKMTVQGELENALSVLFHKQIEVVGSGRTDAGVNAIRQKAHFEVDEEIKDFRKFLHSINGIILNYIKVLSVEETDVHARFSAKKKTYLYRLYKSQYDLPLHTKELRVNPDINVKMMKKCAKFLIGEHDFKNFECSGSNEHETTVRKIYSIKMVENDDIGIDIYVCGNGFLYKMVRNIVGLLLRVGNMEISVEEFKKLAFKTNTQPKKTAPPYALYLYDVKYN